MVVNFKYWKPHWNMRYGYSKFRRYIFDFNDELLDFILVDGKLRDKCSLKGMQLLKEGGFLIIDNINRYVPNKSQSPDSLGYLDKCATTDWEEFYNLTIGWQKIWTSDGITDTAIYLKP